MVVAYPPFFPSQILDDAGQPVANGRVLAYFAGSDVPAPLFSPDGTALGSSVTLNTAGEAVFCLRAGTAYRLTCLDAQGATVWTRENVKVTTADSGMANPMEAEGDLIVGATGGEPARLGVGTAGQVLTSNGTTWTPANIPTQPGDHKTAVDGSDTSPDYLAAKLAAGSGISLTNTGSAVSIAADAQPGDHHVVVTNADASAGTLADKLVAGSNITLTTQTDLDGVQTLEISATGGGGGGGSFVSVTQTAPVQLLNDHWNPPGGYVYCTRIDSDRTGYVSGLFLMQYASYAGVTITMYLYKNEGTTNPLALKAWKSVYFSTPLPPGHLFRFPFDTPVSVNALDALFIGFKYSGTTGNEIRACNLNTAPSVRYVTSLADDAGFPWSTATTYNKFPCVGLIYSA